MLSDKTNNTTMNPIIAFDFSVEPNKRVIMNRQAGTPEHPVQILEVGDSTLILSQPCFVKFVILGKGSSIGPKEMLHIIGELVTDIGDEGIDL